MSLKCSNVFNFDPTTLKLGWLCLQMLLRAWRYFSTKVMDGTRITQLKPKKENDIWKFLYRINLHSKSIIEKIENDIF